MKKKTILLLLASWACLGCSSYRSEPPVTTTKVDINGHTYIQIKTKTGWTTHVNYVHDPDCHCSASLPATNRIKDLRMQSMQSLNAPYGALN